MCPGPASATIHQAHPFLNPSDQPQMSGFVHQGMRELAFSQDPATSGTSAQCVSTTPTGPEITGIQRGRDRGHHRVVQEYIPPGLLRSQV